MCCTSIEKCILGKVVIGKERKGQHKFSMKFVWASWLFCALFIALGLGHVNAKLPAGAQKLENNDWSCTCHPKHPLLSIPSPPPLPPPKHGLRVGVTAALAGLPGLVFPSIPPNLVLPSCTVDPIYQNCVPTNAYLIGNGTHADDIPFGGR